MPQVGSKPDGRGRKKKHPWWHTVKLAPHWRRHAMAIRMQYVRGKEIVVPKPPPLATDYMIRRAGKQAKFGDRELLVYGLKDLGNIYNFEYHRVGGWYANGMLPVPFATRIVAGHHWPLWTYEQAEAICLVLNDIWRQGCVQFAIWHTGHIEMMKKGGAYALRYLDDKGPSRASVLRALTGKHGVVWVDGPHAKESLPELPGWDEPAKIINRRSAPGAKMTILFKRLHEDTPPKPKFKAFHPDFTGTVQVLRSVVLNPKEPESYYTVDLDAGTCSCEYGADYVWLKENRDMKAKWQLAKFCAHKIRAIADITEGDPKTYLWGYIRSIGTRYNKYELPSVFHKELRRGDVPKAVFWGSMLSTKRKLSKVLEYLTKTIYEETRDHTLHRWLVDLAGDGEPSYENVCRAIHAYCIAPKKWMLPHRLAIFEAEMRGYQLLARDYGYGVSGHSNFIASDQHQKLADALIHGFARGDLVQVQRGVKGMFKMKPPFEMASNEDLKWFILELLADVRKGRYRNHFDYDAAGFDAIKDIVLRKRELGVFHYHELNALADALCGEPFAPGCTPLPRLRGIVVNPTPPTVYSCGQLGKLLQMPLYTHDNHTWVGGGLLRRFPHEIKPHVPQQNMDLRLCGAYHGVAWRYLAWNQYGTLDVKWEAVKWPAWLAKHTEQMFY